MAEVSKEPIISIENLTKIFSSGVFFREYTTAVKDVSFAMYPGTILSLIGESGSGKTTIGRMMLKLLRPTSGSIYFHGKDIAQLRSRAERREYYRRVQGIFQDPFSSFNPLFRVDRVFDMVYDVFMPEVRDREARTREALMRVNLNPDRILSHFPHQLSGGQLQRLLIARALLMDVEILVADELISMLDASTRMGILNLLVDICRDTGMSVLFITHDLALGYYVSDYTMIMHQGRLVEQGATAEVYHNPVHPYTKMLFRSVPDIGRRWDPKEKFIPEQVTMEIDEFYAENRGRGMVSVSPEHLVLMSVD
ncbi:MAG: ABC transporter ATP-binding protein [Limnochordia bacterium]